MSEAASPMWYVRRGRRRFGPLTRAEIAALAAGSQFFATDEVSGDAKAWQPAAVVGELPFPATPALEYDAPRDHPPVMTEFATDMLKQTSPYALVMAVLMFIGSG